METVAQALADHPHRKFEAGNYPQMYARWFLKDNPDFVSMELERAAREELHSETNAAGQPRKRAANVGDVRMWAVRAWCKKTGEDLAAVEVLLADEYIRRNCIDAPADRKPIF